MIISRYISNKAAFLLLTLASGMLWGCSADNFSTPDTPEPQGVDGDAQVIINMAIPKGETLPAVNTLLAAASGNAAAPDITGAQQAPEVDELKINDVRLYIFPSANNDAAPAINTSLLTPAELPSGDNKTASYGINGLQRGSSYNMYILANFGEDAAAFSSAKALEDFVVDYTSNAHNLRPGNLPMVYKSSSAIKVNEDKTKPVNLSVALQYACVKLRYNIIFDKNNAATAAAFGEKGLAPANLSLSNVTKKAKIMLDKTTSFYEAEGNSDDNALVGWQFYPECTDNSGVEGADPNADIISVSGTPLQASEVAGKSVWVLRGTTYLPERYVSDNANQTTLAMVSKLDGNGPECNHGCVLGVKSEDYKKLERNTYYEFIGRIVNTGVEGLTWTCNIRDWMDISLPADFVHTYLTLSTTKIDVTSYEDGIITYETDGRGELGFECADDAKRGDIPLFEKVNVESSDGTTSFGVRINSAYKINDDDNESGTAHCFIIAGNIRKQIEVNYNLSAIFEVEPTAIKLQNGDGTKLEDHYFDYRSNLGGFILKSDDNSSWGPIQFTEDAKTSAPVVHQVNGSSITIQLDTDNSSISSGILRVVAFTPATTTIIHHFTIQSPTGRTKIPLTVQVMPNRENYRIYFRAINDYQANDGDGFGTVPDEYNGTGNSNDNWIDYWDSNNRTNRQPNGDVHRLYAYTQYGEAPNVNPVWRYTTSFANFDAEFEYKNPDSSNALIKKSGSSMTGDINNPGWYYYDIPIRCNGDYDTSKQTDNTKPGTALYTKYGYGPIPGGTLLIFYSKERGGMSRHRVNQDKEPGIPLGDYNDCESWVLFDPSRDPIFTVYDDKPIIENVDFIVYSDVELHEWRNDYGLNSIYKSFDPVAQDADGYYRYTIRLKSVAGEYDKNISLRKKRTSTTLSRPIVCLSMDGSSADDILKWGTPCALFNNNGSEEELITMKPNPSNPKEYYIEVPDKWKGQHVKFCSIDYSISRPDWENSNVPSTNVVMKGWANRKDWSQYDASSVTLMDNVTTMFGGRAWRTGYYKNGRWSQSKL